MEVYRRPTNLFVAGFVGSPAMNLLPQPDGTLLGVRPQDLTVVAPGTGDYQGIVDVVEPEGASSSSTSGPGPSTPAGSSG